MSAPKKAGRISINSAFQMLLNNGNEPYVACEQLNAALRAGRVKLFADDDVVTPSFVATHLIVTTAAGVAKVTALRALDRSDYEWTASGMGGLLKPPRQRPGVKPKHDWRAIEAEIARRCTPHRSKRPRLPANQSELARQMLMWCSEKYAVEPAESLMRKAVKRVCT